MAQYIYMYASLSLDELKSTIHYIIFTYRQVSNIIRTLVDSIPGFIGLGKDNCKTRRETFKFGDLVRLILEILRYIFTYWIK